MKKSIHAIAAERDSKKIGLNGAATRTAQAGDLVITSSYGLISHNEASIWKPKIIILN